MNRHLVSIAMGSPCLRRPAWPKATIRTSRSRWVVTVPAGGGVDTVTRLVTERMRTIVGQPFVVENKGGAGGNIAADYVLRVRARTATR